MFLVLLDDAGEETLRGGGAVWGRKKTNIFLYLHFQSPSIVCFNRDICWIFRSIDFFSMCMIYVDSILILIAFFASSILHECERNWNAVGLWSEIENEQSICEIKVAVRSFGIARKFWLITENKRLECNSRKVRDLISIAISRKEILWRMTKP